MSQCPRLGACFSNDCTCHPAPASVSVVEDAGPESPEAWQSEEFKRALKKVRGGMVNECVMISDDECFDLDEGIAALVGALCAARLRLQEVERERDEAKLALGDAAREINCAGPVAHRIRVLRQELSDEITKLSAEITTSRASLEGLRAEAFTAGVEWMAALTGLGVPRTLLARKLAQPGFLKSAPSPTPEGGTPAKRPFRGAHDDTGWHPDD